MKLKLLYLLTILITFSVFTFAGPGEKTSGSGIEIKNIDYTVSPGTDFYEFAVGDWLKNNPIPDDYSTWGSFETLSEVNNKVLREILETAAGNKSAVKGSPMQKAGDFFYTGMDTVKIEKDGYKPIMPLLDAISAVKSKKDLYEEITYLQLRVANPLFNFYAGADAKNSDMNIAGIGQGGIGLPDRDYYINEDARSKQVREKYVEHMTNMFKLIGMNDADAKANADKVMAIETRLAKASLSRVELRDPVKNYNKMSFAELQAITPDIDWNLYFKNLKIDIPKEVDVNQPGFIKEVNAMLKEMQPADFQAYLKWNLLRSAAPYLSDAFVQERFNFYSRFLSGAKAMQPRWKRVMYATNGALGEIVGELFVAKTFPPEAKKRARAIVDNLLVALGERIKNLDWMSENTKEAALKKLAAFTVKIGYPDKWKDYSGVTISRDLSYFENEMNSSEFLTMDNLLRIGKPVDKAEWLMTPQTVNAYYEPSKNEIVFPAAILQPPFYNYNADDAVNYGAMGVVIGHEITHGFDDQGAQFDANGNLKNWWTEEDSKKFKERGQVLIDEFNSFKVIDTLTVNGQLTQGENIADLGGLNVSLTAFKKTDQFKKGELIDGFTPVQRFFLSYAQIWKINIRPETAKLRLKTDPHSPGKFRVLGPLMNMPEFFDAFGVKPGDPMRRSDDKLVKIW